MVGVVTGWRRCGSLAAVLGNLVSLGVFCLPGAGLAVCLVDKSSSRRRRYTPQHQSVLLGRISQVNLNRRIVCGGFYPERYH